MTKLLAKAGKIIWNDNAGRAHVGPPGAPCILAAKGGGYYWHFQAANNEVVCASQVYTTKQAAIDGAYLLKAKAGDAKVYDYTGESK